MHTCYSGDIEGGMRELEIVEAVVIAIGESGAGSIHGEGGGLGTVEGLKVVLVDVRGGH